MSTLEPSVGLAAFVLLGAAFADFDALVRQNARPEPKNMSQLSQSRPVLDFLAVAPAVRCSAVAPGSAQEVQWQVPLEAVGPYLPPDNSLEILPLAAHESAPGWLRRFTGALALRVANRAQVEGWLAVREAMTADEPERAQQLCDALCPTFGEETALECDDDPGGNEDCPLQVPRA